MWRSILFACICKPVRVGREYKAWPDTGAVPSSHKDCLCGFNLALEHDCSPFQSKVLRVPTTSTESMLSNYHPNTIFSAFSFLGFLACTIPLPWHLEAWNVGMCLFMMWTGLGCLMLFINSIVWHHNAINWAPVWCDITVRYVVGLNVAIPLTCLCITRRLYYITVFRIPSSKVDNHRAIICDVMIGIGVPILAMVLQYIVQGHRFNIYEDLGCWPYTYGTSVALAFVGVPPIVICLVAGLYAVLGVYSFLKNRREFDELLSSMGHRNLTLSRYIRLLCFSSLGILLTIPIPLGVLIINLHFSGILPWTGWRETHVGFQRVDQTPAIIWKSDSGYYIELESTRWCVVGSAFACFVFFSFDDAVIKKYRSVLRTVSTNIGLSTGPGLSSVAPRTVNSPAPPYSNSRSNVDAKPPSLPPLTASVAARATDISPMGAEHCVAMTNMRASVTLPSTHLSDGVEVQPLARVYEVNQFSCSPHAQPLVLD